MQFEMRNLGCRDLILCARATSTFQYVCTKDLKFVFVFSSKTEVLVGTRVLVCASNDPRFSE